MSYITDIKTSFKASGVIPAGSRVKYVAGGLVSLAGVDEIEIGVALLVSGKDSYADGSIVGVQLRHVPVVALAAGAFADGAVVQRMASGKVDDTGAGAAYGVALQASSAALDLVPVAPY